MLKEVQSLMLMQMNQSGVSFYVELPAEEIRVTGQEVQLSQVVVICLQNAIDAVKEKGDSVIILRLRGSAEHCLIEVEDNGEGLTEDDENKIFQPFFTTKAVGEGTGLGLSIAHGIVKQHQGAVRVVSRRRPTLFEISIPRQRPQITAVES
jgi:histidine kinase